MRSVYSGREFFPRYRSPRSGNRIGTGTAAFWDGEEGITLFPDLDAGATSVMTGAGYPDGMCSIVEPYLAGRRAEAMAAYDRWLPLINCENRQCGLQAVKILGGVIRSGAVRHPLVPLHPAIRAGLIETARRLDSLVPRWGT